MTKNLRQQIHSEKKKEPLSFNGLKLGHLVQLFWHLFKLLNLQFFYVINMSLNKKITLRYLFDRDFYLSPNPTSTMLMCIFPKIFGWASSCYELIFLGLVFLWRRLRILSKSARLKISLFLGCAYISWIKSSWNWIAFIYFFRLVFWYCYSFYSCLYRGFRWSCS